MPLRILRCGHGWDRICYENAHCHGCGCVCRGGGRGAGGVQTHSNSDFLLAVWCEAQETPPLQCVIFKPWKTKITHVYVWWCLLKSKRAEGVGKGEKDSMLMSASLLGCECPQLVVRAVSRVETHGDNRFSTRGYRQRGSMTDSRDGCLEGSGAVIFHLYPRDTTMDVPLGLSPCCTINRLSDLETEHFLCMPLIFLIHEVRMGGNI